MAKKYIYRKKIYEVNEQKQCKRCGMDITDREYVLNEYLCDKCMQEV